MTFREAVERRVLVFDGAMGTQIQGLGLSAADFGGHDGANDLLTLTRPDLVEAIHARYFAAGCDVVETNTFGSSRLKLDEYGAGHRTHEVNLRAAVLARRAAARHATPGRPRFVAGSIGPTGLAPLRQRPGPLQRHPRRAGARLRASRRAGWSRGAWTPSSSRPSRTSSSCAPPCWPPTPCAARRCATSSSSPSPPSSTPAAACCSAPTSAPRSGHPGAAADRRHRPQLLHRPRPRCARRVRLLGERSSHVGLVLPNAGLPENVDGQAVYPLSPEALADALASSCATWASDLVGGCCGTTPAHLAAGGAPARPRRPPPRPPGAAPRAGLGHEGGAAATWTRARWWWASASTPRARAR